MCRNFRFGNDPNARGVYPDQAALMGAMTIAGIDSRFVVSYMVADLLENKLGPFKLAKDDYKFSTTDALLGYVFWYIMKHFILDRIKQGHLVDVPCLSLTVKAAGEKSEWELMRVSAAAMLVRLGTSLKADTPDLTQVFFKKAPVRAGVALEDDDEPEDDEHWQEGVDDEENPSQADSVDGFGTPAEATTEEAAGLGEDE